MRANAACSTTCTINLRAQVYLAYKLYEFHRVLYALKSLFNDGKLTLRPCGVMRLRHAERPFGGARRAWALGEEASIKGPVDCAASTLDDLFGVRCLEALGVCDTVSSYFVGRPSQRYARSIRFGWRSAAGASIRQILSKSILPAQTSRIGK